MVPDYHESEEKKRRENMSLNRVIIHGNLGADPELRFTTDGRPVCNLRIATSESWKDKEGQLQTRVEWHRVSLWGTTAENAGKYLVKGQEVLVEGKLRTRNYEDKETKKKVYVTEISGDTINYGRKPNEKKSDDVPAEREETAGDMDIPY